MWRYLAGGGAALAMVGAGVLLMDRPSTSSVLPGVPPAQAGGAADTAEQADLPDTVPEASPRTREQKRFARYDKNKDGAIAREEYLASRRKAYAKLDANRDGVLSFDEWAAKSTAKFAAADADKSGSMSPTEFATTAVKRKAARRTACPPTRPATAEEEG